MRTSENLSNIAKALVAAQGDIKGIAKNAQGHGYKYMTFDAILALVKPVLTTHEIFLIQDVHGDLLDDTNLGCCTTRLLHSSGEWIETEKMVIKPQGKQIKGGAFAPVDPQAVGSALTYAKRYQLSGMLGIAADVDDDALIASQKQNWGIAISDAQKAQINGLIAQKGVDKTKFNNLMLSEIGGVKEFKKFTGEEATKMITAMTSMPDAQKAQA